MRSSKSPQCSEMSQDNVKIMRIFFVDINVKINFDRLGSRRYFMCPLTIKTHQCILLCICHNNGISHLYYAILLSIYLSCEIFDLNIFPIKKTLKIEWYSLCLLVLFLLDNKD